MEFAADAGGIAMGLPPFFAPGDAATAAKTGIGEVELVVEPLKAAPLSGTGD